MKGSDAITVVTSFGPKSYLTQGRTCINTFLQYWPQEVELMAYHEGGPLPEWNTYHRLWHTDLLGVKEAKQFLKRHGGNPAIAGAAPYPGKMFHKKNRAYNFRFDAYKFCRKVFAIAHAAELVGHGRLFWLDADVETHKSLPLDKLKSLLPDDIDISYLHRPRYHAECGFVGYNLESQVTRDLIADFKSMYEDDRFIAEDEWHDSWIFDRLVDRHKPKALHIPWKIRGQPFDTSELGQYMTHHKGNKKLMAY